MLQVYVYIITGLNVWELRWYGVFQVLLLLMSLLYHSQGDHSSFTVLHACIVDNPSLTPHLPSGHYPHDWGGVSGATRQVNHCGVYVSRLGISTVREEVYWRVQTERLAPPHPHQQCRDIIQPLWLGHEVGTCLGVARCMASTLLAAGIFYYVHIVWSCRRNWWQAVTFYQCTWHLLPLSAHSSSETRRRVWTGMTHSSPHTYLCTISLLTWHCIKDSKMIKAWVDRDSLYSKMHACYAYLCRMESLYEPIYRHTYVCILM